MAEMNEITKARYDNLMMYFQDFAEQMAIMEAPSVTLSAEYGRGWKKTVTVYQNNTDGYVYSETILHGGKLHSEYKRKVEGDR